MLDKDTINKLRKKAGNEALGLIAALESLEETELILNDMNSNLRKIFNDIYMLDRDIKIAKNRVIAHISMTVSDDI